MSDIRKQKIAKMQQEKHATTIQAQWRGKLGRIRVNKLLQVSAENEIVALLSPKLDSTKQSWPSPLLENFGNLTPLIAWPCLDGESKDCWSWINDYSKIIVRCITWNLCGNAPPTREEIRKLILPLNRFHMLVVGTEECERSIQASMINPSKKQWESVLLDVLGEKYAPIRSHTLQAIHIMIFVHISLVPFISGISSDAVTTGIGNTLGNKGGVGVKVTVGETSFLFVNSHLAAHQNAIRERNNNLNRIESELFGKADSIVQDTAPAASPTAAQAKSTPADTPQESEAVEASSPTPPAEPSPEAGKPMSPAPIVRRLCDAAHAVVFMGDMNYRIRGNRKIVDTLLAENMYEVLYNNDQLLNSLTNGLILHGFKEPPLNFKPTYKFDIFSDVYDTGSKKRIPAWTDRILYNHQVTEPSMNVLECIAYNADFEMKTSDHRPVYATFVADVKFSEDHSKLLRSLICTKLNGDGNDIEFQDKIEFSSQSQVCTVS